MLTVASRMHATLAESSLSAWSPVLLCSRVPDWDRAWSHAQGPLHLPHHCRHLPAPGASHSAPSQSTLPLADLFGSNLGLCLTRYLLLLHCWPFWNIFCTPAGDEGFLSFWKSCLCSSFVSLASQGQCHNFLICPGRKMVPSCTVKKAGKCWDENMSCGV